MSLSSSPASTAIPLPGAARLLLLIPVILVLLGGWFSIRWLLGATISEVATAGDTPNLELARVAARWAPADPFVHWRLGVASQRDLSPTRLEERVRQFEAAVRLSPNDFRYWDELGRGFEATGDRDGAEKALRRATDLAPHYYYPRWHLGNLLLRSGDYQEGFQQMFRAAQAYEPLWPQVLNLAWQAYDGDVESIAEEACKEPSVRALFASYLVGLKRFDDALRLWKTIPADSRARVAGGGRTLRKAFLDAGQFRAAFEVHRDLEPPGSEVPEPEKFSNGGFEEVITLPVTRLFGWTIGSNVQAQTSLSGEAHTGRRSLQIVLSASNRLERINASHTIVVAPNTPYHFECYARTDKLNSASTPVVVILDGATNKALAHSAPLPTGTTNWQKISVDFSTNSDGIMVTISRLP